MIRHNHTIPARIALLLASLVLTSIATGIVIVRKVEEVAAVGDVMARQVEGISVLGDLGMLSQRLMGLEALRHFSTEASDRFRYGSAAADGRWAFSRAMSRYSSLVADGRESELAASLRQAWQHSLAVQEEIAALDAAGLTALATSVLQRDLCREALGFSDAILAIQAFRQGEVAATQKSARDIGAFAKLGTVIVLGMLTGFWCLVGGIVGPVASSATEPQATARTMTATAHQSMSIAEASQVFAATSELSRKSDRLSAEIARFLDIVRTA